MSATMNTRIQFKRDNTANWNAARGFVPLDGEMIVYTDYERMVEEVNGEEKVTYIPGVKIGDGQTYVQDLPFIDDGLRKKLLDHINNPNIHVSAAEKLFWNNKLNVDDSSEVVDTALIFNRN